MFVGAGNRAGRGRAATRLDAARGLTVQTPGTTSSGSGQFPVLMKSIGGDATATGFAVFNPSNLSGSFFSFAFCGAQMAGTRFGLADLHNTLLMFSNGAASNPAQAILLGASGAAPVYIGTNNLVRLTVSDTGQVTASAPTGGLGYGTGAGGTVTQATSKSTGVTLNKVCGQITMNSAALAAGAEVGFTVTNSAVAATDVIIVNIGSGATAASYGLSVDAVAAGSFKISVTNWSAGSLSEAIVINFAVIKAVTS